MKELVVTLLMSLLLFSVLGLVLGLTCYTPCAKPITPAQIWNKATNTKFEKLLIKPMTVLMSPGIYIGIRLATPSRCYK